MEDIVNKEIAEKVIEKSKEDPTPDPVEDKPVKQKKPRTQKQKEAFEKARAKRLENIAKKKIEEEQYSNEYPVADETNPYVLPTDEPPKPVKKRGRPRGSAKFKREDPPRPPHNYPQPVAHQIPQGYNHGIPQQPSGISYFNPPSYYPPPTPQPAQIHNYYYGANPHQPQPQPQPEPQQLKFKVEEPEEEEEIVEEPVEQEIYEEPQQPIYKYRFA